MVAKAGFGLWTAYVEAQVLGLSAPVTLAPAQDPVDGPASDTVPTWSAPLPLCPGHLAAFFTPGSRLACGAERIAVVAEPRQAGLLHLPTGSVMAIDPDIIWEGDLPFTVTVAPGDYPVLIASMQWEGEEREEATPAVMLRILDKPTSAGGAWTTRPDTSASAVRTSHEPGDRPARRAY